MDKNIEKPQNNELVTIRDPTDNLSEQDRELATLLRRIAELEGLNANNGTLGEPSTSKETATSANVDQESQDQLGAVADKIEGLKLRPEKLSGSQRRKLKRSRANMEGQKNLPKEGDKGTDDLKKSKGTEAQKPEDKGQEPPCKKTHWVPTYRDVVTDDKKVALVLAGYPTNKLTTEHGLLIESCVGDLILSGTDGTDVPRFEDTRLTDGALVISAAQESSLKWLTDHVNLIKPWDGAELHLEAYNPIKYKRMVTHIPGLPKESKKILEILAKQNPGLNTAIWKVHHETEVGPKGQTLFLSVDENSMVKLKELKCSPYFGMGRVCFTDYVAKQPPARKDVKKSTPQKSGKRKAEESPVPLGKGGKAQVRNKRTHFTPASKGKGGSVLRKGKGPRKPPPSITATAEGNLSTDPKGNVESESKARSPPRNGGGTPPTGGAV
ncbi:uncharacterized protein LOC126897607 [Daktulosphaira vitifoliae]|uniref:uncharacterized protein LOC126897607 n=1 Tax=Daktulosphaira vitifoliae TaxID=58002 RepID=UPI0021AACF21|nr:uncharacterized protein LOC126897607 [Daktulosphaira vitifoliae]